MVIEKNLKEQQRKKEWKLSTTHHLFSVRRFLNRTLAPPSFPPVLLVVHFYFFFSISDGLPSHKTRIFNTYRCDTISAIFIIIIHRFNFMAIAMSVFTAFQKFLDKDT